MAAATAISSEQTTASAGYVLTDEAFGRLRELVRMHTGIALSDAKRQLVYGRLVRRLRALGLTTFEHYIEILERDEGTELEEFVNAVTTNLTAFYREAHHFDYLERTAIPAAIERNRSTRRIRIWSTACSTGEEPYSIAMVLCEQGARLAGYDTKILATDLDSNVLATAAAGLYSAERLRGVPADKKKKYFETAPGRDGVYRVSQSLRDLVIFKRLNLMNEWPMRGPFDVIFCRNVVIYFDKETQRRLFSRIADLQRPGDILCLGHSESLYRVTDRYELLGKTIYRRI